MLCMDYLGLIGTINSININYFCHILFLLGSLLIIRLKKLSVSRFLLFHIKFILSVIV